MTKNFDDLKINAYLTPDLDPTWRSKIESAFPYPYITQAEAAADTYGYDTADIQAALARNLEVATQERQRIIAQIPLLDTIGAMAILETRAAVDTARRQHEIIAIEDHGAWLYPAFQFDPQTFKPYPIIARLNNRFIKHDINHWGELLWWFTKNSHLQDQSPAHVLQNGRGDELEILLREDTQA